MTIMYPYKFVGRFEDNKGDWTEIITYSSFSESDCIQQLIDLQDKYGQLTWYSGCNDEDSVMIGEIIEETGECGCDFKYHELDFEMTDMLRDIKEKFNIESPVKIIVTTRCC